MVAGLGLLLMLMANSGRRRRSASGCTAVSWLIFLALLARIERKHLIFLLIVIFAMRSLVMVVPVDLAVFAALDIATYVDAALTVWTVAAVTRIRGAGAWTAGLLRAGRRSSLRPRAGPRMPRGRRLPMSLRAPANNDEDAGARPLAA